MKNHLFIALLCFTIIPVTGQNLDHLMTRHFISCQDIEYNSSFLIPSYYRRAETDSLKYILDYWENRCGYNELIFQTRTLLDIKEKKFNEENIDKTWIYRLMDISRNRRPYPYSPYNWRYYQSNYTNGLFQEFLDSLSTDLEKENLSETENFLVSFYAGNSKLGDLKDKYPGSKLNDYYSQFVDSVLRLPEFTLAIYTGAFFPTQSAATLGNHGLLGFGIGGIFYKNSIDLLLDFKFGPPKEQYHFLYHDSLISSDIYTGMYVGLEYGRTILIKEKSEYYISGGVGSERITAVYRDEEKDRDPKFLWSSAYSLGVGYRYRYDYKNSISLQFRYQYLDYNNPSGTRLKGGSYTLRLLWILSSNHMRNLIQGL